MKQLRIHLMRKRKWWLEDGEVMMMEMVWECCDFIPHPPSSFLFSFLPSPFALLINCISSHYPFLSLFHIAVHYTYLSFVQSWHRWYFKRCGVWKPGHSLISYWANYLYRFSEDGWMDLWVSWVLSWCVVSPFFNGVNQYCLPCYNMYAVSHQFYFGAGSVFYRGFRSVIWI
jgi:hypothetical protein